ncbi:hypothetical protein CKA56_16195, partial [Arcobacter venerupis]
IGFGGLVENIQGNNFTPIWLIFGFILILFFENSMEKGKEFKILLTLYIFVVGFVGGVNYLVDPFDVFHTKILKEQFQINERFVKIEFLEKNHNKFDSYMFGSSCIGTTPPDVLNQYMNDANFYNFTIASANLYDYLLHLQYFIKKEYPLKNLYLEIDINNMNNYGRSES